MTTPLRHDSKHRPSLFRRQILVGLLAVGVSIFRSAHSAENVTATSATTPAYTELHHTNECRKPAIEEFPGDFMSQDQRNNGGIIAHILIATYLILALAIICDEFFVPVLEIICDTLHLSSDVAGATFMAAGTSSPEFFANIMGTFVTESDLGIGTIVGSAVFNILGIVSVCGIFTGQRVPIDWYPITRDCVAYGLTVVVLILVLMDEQVMWWESLLMLSFYSFYILLMYFNTDIEKWAHSVQKSIKKKIYPSSSESGSSTPRPQPPANESTPLHNIEKGTQASLPTATVGTMTTSTEMNNMSSNGNSQYHDQVDAGPGEEVEDGEKPRLPWVRPAGEGVLAHIWWLLYLPLSILFFLTIPDVRYPKFRRWYPISFVMCMAWIGVVSYIVTWMITIIGYTFQIPDSVMGLTFLAVGTSIPEVFSSLIVSRQGKGSMAVSNSIGSNTFDILICLGLPWLCKSIMQGSLEGTWYVSVDSEALVYTVISLLTSLIFLYAIFLVGRFVLSKTMGLVTAIIYSVFLTISIMFELNVFFFVNPPTCKTTI